MEERGVGKRKGGVARMCNDHTISKHENIQKIKKRKREEKTTPQPVSRKTRIRIIRVIRLLGYRVTSCGTNSKFIGVVARKHSVPRAAFAS